MALLSTHYCQAGLPREGSRVSIYWPAERTWYKGEVKAIDGEGRSYVSYDDREVEILFLAVERFKLEGITPCLGVHLYLSA